MSKIERRDRNVNDSSLSLALKPKIERLDRNVNDSSLSLALKPKVFIGCVTYAKDAYALPYFLGSLASFNNDIDWDLFFVDTTAAGAPALAPYTQLDVDVKKTFPDKKIKILSQKDVTPGTWFIEIIAKARQQLQKEFLKKSNSKYTHFLFVDDDMIFPSNTLSLLLSYDDPVVCGVYLGNLSYPTDITPTKRVAPIGFVSDLTDPNHYRPLTIAEVMPSRRMNILLSGFGVALIRRDVVERVPLKYNSENKSSEDTPFFLDLYRLKINAKMDTRVKCAHLKYPIGDERNKLLDFANYR